MRSSRFEVSQFPPLTGNGCVGGGQKDSQVPLSHQGTFKSQNQLR